MPKPHTNDLALVWYDCYQSSATAYTTKKSKSEIMFYHGCCIARRRCNSFFHIIFLTRHTTYESTVIFSSFPLPIVLFTYIMITEDYWAGRQAVIWCFELHSPNFSPLVCCVYFPTSFLCCPCFHFSKPVRKLHVCNNYFIIIILSWCTRQHIHGHFFFTTSDWFT